MTQRFALQSRRQIPAILIRALIIGVYGGLAIASAWILKDYAPGYIIDRVLPFGLPPLLSLLSGAFLSVFVLSLERMRVETILFSLICLAFAGLNLDIFLLGIITDPDLALTISRIDHFFLVLVTLGANLHLAYLVAEKRTQWWVVYLAYACGGAIAVFTPTDLYLQGVHDYYWGFFAKKNILYDVMSAIWLTAVFYCVYVLGRAYRQTGSRRKRGTIKYLIYGFVAAGVLSLTNTPAIYGYEVYPLGTFIFISLFLLAYGLFKYNLRVALEQLRSLAFRIGHLALIIAVGFFPWVFLSGSAPRLRMLAGVILVAIAYHPLSIFWDKALNLAIKRTSARLQGEYYNLTYTLSGLHHLQAIYQEISRWLFRVLMNSRCAMAFYNEKTKQFEGWRTWNTESPSGFFSGLTDVPAGDQPMTLRKDHPLIQKIAAKKPPLLTHGRLQQWLAEDRLAPDKSDWLQEAGVVIPVFSENQIICLLMAGNKINDRSYITAEQEMLKNIGVILAPIIENARFFERLEYLVERRTRALHRTLADARKKSQQIAAINQTIKKQNHIFLSLFKTSSQIHNIEDLNELFGFTLKHLRSLFPHLAFGIILEGGRSDILESGAFKGLTALEQLIVLKHRAHLGDPAIDHMLKSERPPHLRAGTKDRPFYWRTLPLQVKDNRIIGHMVIKGPALEQTSLKVIGIFLAQVSAVAQYKLLMRQLETMASTDGLTGVANRAFFEKAYAEHLGRARQFPDIHFSLMMLDLNGLKRINDRYGHEKGDEGIQRVARMLSGLCRETDILARIGGDEFALLLPSVDSHNAQALRRRIREEEEQLVLPVADPHNKQAEIPLRISIGLAGSDETAPEKVMKLADQRMYAEKESYYQTPIRAL
jgi:diguanylate cyclase (GGDEF)-like protein